jgi:subfamily B ATP-binding cassette protein HlyB/CyaB
MKVHMRGERVEEKGREREILESAIRSFLVAASALGIEAEEEELYQMCATGETDGYKALLHAAKVYKVKVKVIKNKHKTLRKFPVPAIAIMGDGTYCVIGHYNAKNIMVYDTQAGKPAAVLMTEFLNKWTGEIIEIKRPFSIREAGRRFNLAWFIPVILRYKHFFAEVLVASFFLQVFALVTPVFTQVIIDKVIVHKGMVTLNVLALVLFISAIFQMLMSILRTYLSTHTTNKIDMILGTRLFRHLMSLPLRYFEMRRVGDTLTRLSALNGVREFLTGSALTVMMDTFFSVVFILVMLHYSVDLTLVSLLVLPLYIVQNMAATPVFRKRLEAQWASGAESNAFLVEAITGIHTVKALALEPQFNHRWENILARYVRTTFESSKFNIMLTGSGSLIQNLIGFAVLLFGGHKVMNGDMTIGELIAFQMLSSQASTPLHRLTGMWQTFQQTALSVDRLGDILNTPPERTLRVQDTALEQVRGDITFENVVFRYHAEGSEVLKQVSFAIKAGMKVGIAGRSGSGKSTVTKLIQRLYLPESGRVSIDGSSLTAVEPLWLRKQIGVVLQDSFLFNGSVRDNIAWAWPSASIDDVIKAARMAGAHDFILEMPEGYDTKVGERGSRLSGGQKQRLAIARAILTNPPILIFDEATSALDYESERIISANLDEIAKGRTMVIIAHRLSTIKKCDNIIVMDHGRVAEQGSHANLMEQQGYYYNLYKQQEG